MHNHITQLTLSFRIVLEKCNVEPGRLGIFSSVGWASQAQPNSQTLAVLPLLAFVPQPNLHRILSQLLIGIGEFKVFCFNIFLGFPTVSNRLLYEWAMAIQLIL